MTDDFDNEEKDDEDWRTLAKFGVERNQVRANTSHCLQLYLHGTMQTRPRLIGDLVIIRFTNSLIHFSLFIYTESLFNF